MWAVGQSALTVPDQICRVLEISYLRIQTMREHWGRGSIACSLPADPTTPASTHTVHDFVTFFRHKVEDIRTAMSTATSPDIHV